MPATDLMRWSAFEHVYGPLLPHERVDIGLAQVAYLLVCLLGGQRRRPDFRKFLPQYMQQQYREARTQNADELHAFMEGLARANH